MGTSGEQLHGVEKEINPTRLAKLGAAAAAAWETVSRFVREKGVKTVASVAGFAVVGGVITACTPGEADANGPTDAIDETSEPVERVTPEPSETVDPFIQEWIEINTLEREPIPAELVKYQDMSLDEFKALPFLEQQPYANWLTSYRRAYEKAHATATEDEPVTLTPDSSARDIFRDYLNTLRMAAYQTIGDPQPRESDYTCGELDEDAAAKIISALSVPVSDGVLLNSEATTQQLFDTVNGRAICPTEGKRQAPFLNADQYADFSEGAERREVVIDGVTVTLVNIKYRTGEAAHIDEKIQDFYLFPDANGELHAKKGNSFTH